nr:type IV secretory system conjugative DNA transfer family protein [uncultured Tyzzerella sp.]
MKEKLKENLVPILLVFLLFVFFNKYSEAIRNSQEEDFINKVVFSLLNIKDMFKNGLISLNLYDILAGIFMPLILYGIATMNPSKNYKNGIEYGSASWGTKKDILPFIDQKNFNNNVLLSQTEQLTMSSRPKKIKYARNKNILIVGGSGSGKTRFFVKPNLMQMHSSYVVTDPKGTIVIECGKMLKDNGYDLKILNTINFKKSMKYNPFAYIKNEKDVLKFVETLVANTQGSGAKEDFWVKAEKLYYTALVGYIMTQLPEKERNMSTLLYLVNNSQASEQDENFKNPVDLRFEELEKKDPNHFAVGQYKKFKLASGETTKSILISCATRLSPFDIPSLKELTEYDDMNLDTLGDKKTALFVIISDTDATFNFLVSIMYTQLFNLLCEKADDVYDGRLPVHVRFLLDEFANIGQIPNFDKLIATIRSRELSASIILQTKSQLKSIYKENADTIVGNCDTTLFLGGGEETTLKDMSEVLGKETIDILNNSLSRGQSSSYSTSYQKMGRELMSKNELFEMDGAKCIVRIRGAKPFLSNKFDITKHKNYKLLLDSDDKNKFDVEKYLASLEPNLKMGVNDEVIYEETYAGDIAKGLEAFENI